jgi:hypothetical protein
MDSRSISRRNFIGKTAATTGLAAFGAVGISNSSHANDHSNSVKFPRKVWIATVSQMGLMTESPAQMCESILKVLEKATIYQPDILAKFNLKSHERHIHDAERAQNQARGDL